MVMLYAATDRGMMPNRREYGRWSARKTALGKGSVTRDAQITSGVSAVPWSTTVGWWVMSKAAESSTVSVPNGKLWQSSAAARERFS